MILTTAVFSIVVIWAGCSNKPEGSQIKPDLFAKIYTDLLLTPIDTTASDSLQKLQKVLKQHDVSWKEYQESMDYFRAEPQRWLEVFSKVVERLEEIEESERQKRLEESTK